MNNEQENTNTQKAPAVPSNASLFYDVFDAFIKSAVFVVILLCILFKVLTVTGVSMSNTLHNGEKIIISNLFYTPKESDIVVFHDTGNLNEFVVKRVIATGGKWVRIDFDAGEVYVSEDDIFEINEIIDEGDYVYLDRGYYKMTGVTETYVPEGYLFVMGDNRNNSLDSRYSEVGLVDERSIMGKVIFRFFPFDRIGTVN
ncbi:MAG: signal peptidase I [Eubacteriales bacterium]